MGSQQRCETSRTEIVKKKNGVLEIVKSVAVAAGVGLVVWGISKPGGALLGLVDWGISKIFGAKLGLLEWGRSKIFKLASAESRRLMKAPGRDGYIFIDDFESNAAGYFHDLRR